MVKVTQTAGDDSTSSPEWGTQERTGFCESVAVESGKCWFSSGLLWEIENILLCVLLLERCVQFYYCIRYFHGDVARTYVSVWLMRPYRKHRKIVRETVLELEQQTEMNKQHDFVWTMKKTRKIGTFCIFSQIIKVHPLEIEVNKVEDSLDRDSKKWNKWCEKNTRVWHLRAHRKKLFRL